MYCNNCGKEAGGNFCSHCGQPLPTPKNQISDTKEWNPDTTRPPQPTPTGDTSDVIDTAQLRFSKVDEAVRKKSESSQDNLYPAGNISQVHKVKKMVVNERPQRASSSSRPVKVKTRKKGVSDNPLDIFPSFSFSGKGLSRVARGLSSILRYVSVGCMAILTLYTAVGLWKEKDLLGSIMRMTREENYALYLFSALSLFIFLFGCLSCLWIYSRRKTMDGRKMVRYDTGRGLVPFLFFGLLTFFAPIIMPSIPSSPDFLRGLEHVLQVFFVHKTLNLWLCFIGIVCSILRGVKFH